MNGSFRVACLVSHPIQYQAPLFRYIAARPGVDLTVFFLSDFSVRAYRDSGFGVDVKWDVPLLDGYRHEFLPRLAPAWGFRSGGRGRMGCARGSARALRRVVGPRLCASRMPGGDRGGEVARNPGNAARGVKSAE